MTITKFPRERLATHVIMVVYFFFFNVVRSPRQLSRVRKKLPS